MIHLWLAALASLFRPRADLILENAALRQQLTVLLRRQPRTRMRSPGRAFWVVLHRIWPRWRDALILVKPETVVRWHRMGFRAYWTRKSRRRQHGRPRIDPKLRTLIRRMAKENPLWGAPRIHAELQLLGCGIAERTVLRYLPRPSHPDAVRRWKIFLEQHRKALVGMDFFTVHTVTFQVLHVLFLIHHDRRQVVHFAVTTSPTLAWIRQQLREAFPYDSAPRYLILDRDPRFGRDVLAFIRDLGIKPVRTAPKSPWQNGIAERWVGSVRRELLDHVIVCGESHLRRLLTEYVGYYNDDRPHLSLAKEAPMHRPETPPPRRGAEIVSFPRCGGLHHRYVSWLTVRLDPNERVLCEFSLLPYPACLHATLVSSR